MPNSFIGKKGFTEKTRKERIIKIPEDIDAQDVLKIDTKNMVLNLEPFVREAVFISLPYRFIKDPQAQAKPASDKKSYKPFSNLKDLM